GREAAEGEHLFLENSTACQKPVQLSTYPRRRGLVLWGWFAVTEICQDHSTVWWGALWNGLQSVWREPAVCIYAFNGEFDPGSGRTLAACLTHASRAERPFGVLERRTGE